MGAGLQALRLTRTYKRPPPVTCGHLRPTKTQMPSGFPVHLFSFCGLTFKGPVVVMFGKQRVTREFINVPG